MVSATVPAVMSVAASAALSDGFSRFRQLCIGWGTVGLVYFGVGYLENSPVTLSESWLDRELYFTPDAVWVYLSFFLFIPYAFKAVSTENLLRLRYAMQICALIAGAVFFFYPTQIVYPALSGDGLSIQALKLLMSVDSTKNCLPSLHAALSLVCVLALWNTGRPIHSILSLIAGTLISISIVKLRRHLSIDLGAGLFLGAIAYFLAGKLTPGKY